MWFGMVVTFTTQFTVKLVALSGFLPLSCIGLHERTFHDEITGKVRCKISKYSKTFTWHCMGYVTVLKEMS